MARQVNIFEAKQQFSELIREARSGSEVVIASRGKPVAKLVPFESKAEASPLGSGPALVAWFRANRLPRRHQRTAAEIDAYIEGERRAWD